MKKTVRNTLISVLGASLIAGSVPSAAFAEETIPYAIDVSIRIEGVNECLYSGDVVCQSGTETALLSDILKFADESSEEFEITWTDSDYGAYISAVNGEAEATFGAWDGWMFRVNGVSPSVGVSAYEVSDGDEIVLYYCYMDEAVSMQYPEMSYDSKTGVLSFTSIDTTGYDENWNPVFSEQPVSGMTVTWIYDGSSESYVTDENGEIKLPVTLQTPGDYMLSYEKKGTQGEPLVLRSAPGFILHIDYLTGDVNGDLAIDAIDASMILTAYANIATGQPSGLSAAQETAADIDGNGTADAVDSSKVLSYYAYAATGGEESFEEFINK